MLIKYIKLYILQLRENEIIGITVWKRYIADV